MIRRDLVAALSVTALLTTGACAATPVAAPPAQTDVQVTGVVGAMDFTNGYITLGAGDTVVDSYFDPMCPYCAQFEAANGEQLAAMVGDGTITLRLHPMVFLDQLSKGTEYSTRATNTLIGVAVLAPDSTLAYLQLLFTYKPEENSEGLTDDQLASLVRDATAGGSQSIAIDQVLTDRPYAAWAAANTAAATAHGGVTNADVTTVDHVPLVLVNGHTYSGGLSDSAAFAAFVAAN
jgi:protein-disulfide isomerase